MTDLNGILARLKELWETRQILEQHGPNSPDGSQWLADVRACLELADNRLALQFTQLSIYATLPLSGYTLGPIWTNMQMVLRTAITKLQAQLPSPTSKVYGPGDAFEVYRDLSQIISAAEKGVFVIDPYADEELFELYLSKVRAGVQIRILTAVPSSKLRLLAGKFGARKPGDFAARHSPDFHDRVVFIDNRYCWVVGQSVKDAAMKKPTYLVPIEAVSDMAQLYESIWESGTKY